ncbi:MAG: hypothetical protein EOM85_00405 [Candidatus Moranbacteria bacterium]|nr:hypothetical protein [Candidatus Moranbacteria bacterium]
MDTDNDRRLLTENILGLSKIFSFDPISTLKYFEKLNILESNPNKEIGAILYPVVSPFGLRQITPDFFIEERNNKNLSNDLDFEGFCLILCILSKIRGYDIELNDNKKIIYKNMLPQQERLAEAIEKIYSIQGNAPLWIIEAQLGNFHKGESVNTSQKRYRDNEYDLPLSFLSSILLISPIPQLKILASGGWFDYADYSFIPKISNSNGIIEINIQLPANADPEAGIPTFFI